MSEIRSLGYVGIRAKDLTAWSSFATAVLGLEENAESADVLRYRMDEYSGRLWVHKGDEATLGTDETDDVAYIGFEVADETGLQRLTDKLNRAGIECVPGSKDVARRRGVTGLIAFREPDGLMCEAYYGPSVEFERPFRSPRSIRGFVTGDQGFGHVVLAVSDIEASLAFFRDSLTFRLSDVIDLPRKGQVRTAYFLHCNSRHHTIALVQAPIARRLLHLMIETQTLDDVGGALDTATSRGVPIVASLGRHVNDHMVSFYMSSPSGFAIEYGWGARSVDDSHWSVQRHKNGSIWGHRGPLTA